MLRVSIFLGLLALATACNRDPSGAPGKDMNAQDRAGTTHVTSASFTTKESAVDRITAARCAREVTCSNLGPDKHFTTNDNCVLEVREHMNKELNSNECPDGIDAKQVDECLDKIRDESCTNPLSTVQRLAECRTSAMCLKTSGRSLF